MHTYSIDEARKIVLNCAKQYAKNLAGKNYIIIYRDRISNNIKSIEIQFDADNYQHLTGIEMIDFNGNIRSNAAGLFYSKCVKNRLRKDEICFKKDGTTSLKLMALPIIMDIQKITKIAGDYNNSRTYLIADKLVGNVNFCLGLKEISSGFYVPVSALLEDIKKLSMNQSQVLAIFSKAKTEEIYKTVRYVAKGINLHKIKFSCDVGGKVSLENYKEK